MTFVLRRRHLKTVIVTLKSGEAFRGALWQHDRDGVVLRSAVALSPDGSTMTAVDGELLILRENLAYIQRP